MAESHVIQDGTSTVPPSGKVNNVRQKWLVYEDGAIAHNEQEKEFHHKYDWNRQDRRTARKDVPLARVCATEEEERKQREAMERLERNRQLEQRDTIAAEKMMSEMILDEQRQRIAREMQDERVAQVLQESEQRKFEQKQRERALAKERKRLERDLASRTQGVLPGDALDNNHNTAREMQGRRMRPDGRVEDLGDFSDFYIPPDSNMDAGEAKHLREMQDEELARLLQDQEHKRGGQVNKDKLKAIEAQDEELALVMQEQEKLKLQKRQAKHAAKRQMSQPAYPPEHPSNGPYPPQRAQSDRADYNRSTSERGQHPPSRVNGDRGDYPPQRVPSERGEYPPQQDPRMAHRNGHHSPHQRGTVDERHSHHQRSPVDSGRMSPPLEHAPIPEELRTNNDTYLNARFHETNRNNRSRGGDREVESLQRTAPKPPKPRQQQPAPPAAADTSRHKPQEAPTAFRPQDAEGNVFSAIDPTASNRLPSNHTSPQQPYPPQQVPNTGDEDGYCELGDLGVVQGQRRDGSKKGSTRRNSNKKGQCKQQ